MESAHDNTERYSVLLIGNYAPDKQQSMRRYAELLCSELTERGQDVAYITPPVFFGKLGAKATGIGKWIGYLDKFLVFPIILRRRIRASKQPLVIHICDHSNAIYTKYLQDTPHVVTCHDLLAIRSALGEFEENQTAWPGRQLQAMILRGLKRSRCITSVSSATRNDVIRLVGADSSWSHQIPNALDHSFIEEAHQTPQCSPSEKRLVENRYVMHIGSDSWYKNRTSVLQIYSKLANSHQDLNLVIVGSEFTDDVLKETNCEHLKNQIRYFKNINDPQLRTLYKQAELLIFPSKIEGFGWPILEAQACGCAVFTLDQEPMNELNACPNLKLKKLPNNSLNGVNLAAAKCLDYMDAPDHVRTELKSEMKAFAASFNLGQITPQYIQLYEAQLKLDR